MRIAILSDPNNFHTQKWAKALEGAGADVMVMSYDPVGEVTFPAIQLEPPLGKKGQYSYWDYLLGGNVLAEALRKHQIDLVNPLNITPFGVWARKSGFEPVLACAFGADILEYPPKLDADDALRQRGWSQLESENSWLDDKLNGLKRKFHRQQVQKALQHAALITGDNQYLVQRMQDWFEVPPAKLKALPWGVEPELFAASPEHLDQLRHQFNIRPGQKVIFSPRGAKPIYQADIILAAFEKILENQGEAVNLIMLSAGYPLSPSLRRKAEALESRHENFHLVQGQLPRESVYALWNLIDIFVSAPIYDGYSAALAEGRYIGAIPVVNAIPANLELIEHGKNGWICDPFEPNALANSIFDILANLDAFKSQFGPVNRSWIEAHSILEKNAAAFLHLASTLLHQA